MLKLIKTIVGLVGVSGLAYALGLRPGNGDKKSDKDPLQIAKRRFAEGDIDRDEFREIREELEK